MKTGSSASNEGDADDGQKQLSLPQPFNLANDSAKPIFDLSKAFSLDHEPEKTEGVAEEVEDIVDS